jgi:hypothetical protein
MWFPLKKKSTGEKGCGIGCEYYGCPSYEGLLDVFSGSFVLSKK